VRRQGGAGCPFSQPPVAAFPPLTRRKTGGGGHAREDGVLGLRLGEPLHQLVEHAAEAEGSHLWVCGPRFQGWYAPAALGSCFPASTPAGGTAPWLLSTGAAAGGGRTGE
jgi:hypothetical protein